MRAVLIGSSGLVLGREYPLDASVVTIGRRDENMIVIKDPTVSRKHAEIRREGDALVIVDKGSTSGITINGQVIAGPHPLRDGDRIGIGSSAVFLIQLQPVEDKTISFAQQQFGEANRTQFITRDLGDPRASAAPNAQPSGPQGGQRPGETMIQHTPFAPPAPPPPSPRPAPASPPSPAPSFAPPPSAAPAGQGWGEPPRAQQPAPDFAPPRPSVDLGGPPLSPPTMPDMPRTRPEVNAPLGMGQPPAPPDFGQRFDTPPPPPGGNLPPISAVTEFAPSGPSNPGNPLAGGPMPQFGNQQPQFGGAPPQFGGPPQFGNQPQQFGGAPPQFGNQQPQFGGPAPQFGNQQGGPGPMMSPPPPPSAAAGGGRAGLVIALIVVVILVLIAAVVVGVLLTGKLG